MHKASMAFLFALSILVLAPELSLAQLMESPVPPTAVANCTPQLLSLTPCAPFVQGVTRVPLQTCCDNLLLLSVNQPTCVCLLSSNLSIINVPVNTTLAMKLPKLCDVQLDTSYCHKKPRKSLAKRHHDIDSIVAAPPMADFQPSPAPSDADEDVQVHRNDGLKIMDSHKIITFVLFVVAAIF